MKTLSTFATTVALIARLASCATAPTATQYNLNIFNTDGGEVMTPGVASFSYNAGTMVDLHAEAEEGCQFVNRAGAADNIVSVQDATTTITMDDAYCIAAGVFHTMGLKSDGTVVAVGASTDAQRNVSNRTHIAGAGTSGYHTLGLKSDDTLVAASIGAAFAKWNVMIYYPYGRSRQ